MSIEESLKNNTVLKDYKDSVTDLLDYALDEYSKAPFALKAGKQMAQLNVMGFHVQQSIQSYDLYTPDGNYSQSWSASPFLSTKDRFYDEKGYIKAYTASGVNLMKDAKSVRLEYDAFIQKYGKLPKRKYFVRSRFVDKSSLIHDSFVPEAKVRKEEASMTSIRTVYGTLIYQIQNDTVTKSTLEQTEDGYVLSFDLDVRYALDYYATQMMNIASLYELPKFTLSKVTVRLDRNLHLLSASCHDEFSSKTGFISAKVSMDSQLTFLTSVDNRFTYHGKTAELIIPKKDTPFNGDDLFD